MNKLALSKKSRYILLAGALLLLMGSLYRFYPYFSDLWPDDSQLDAKIKRVAKYQKMVQERDRLQQRLVEMTRHLERAERICLEGSTPALAAVEIQNIINQIETIWKFHPCSC